MAQTNNFQRSALVLVFMCGYFLADNLFYYSYEKITGEVLVADWVRAHHPVYHHGFRPGYSNVPTAINAEIYRISTNSLGFKDSEAREVPLKTTNHRLLFIGDSFGEGYGLPFEKTFAGFFSQKAKESGIEVLNASVSSYSPLVYFHKIKYLSEVTQLQFDEVILFLDISDLQDERLSYFEEDGVVKSQYTEHPVDFYLNKYIRFFLPSTYKAVRLFFPLQLRYKNEENYSVEYLKRERTSWTFDETVWETSAQQMIPKMKERMKKISDLLKQKNIRLTVAVYPWQNQIRERDLNSRQVTIWKEWTTQNGVGFINLFPDFINEDTSADTRYFINNEFHWNEAGHALVAQKLAEIYLKQ